MRKLYIQDVRGIELLDHSWAPRFNQLERVEIYYSDIRSISRNFGLLHRDNLKYLAIRAAKIEFTEAKAFDDLVNLEYLDLSANPIKQLSMETFYGLNSLKSLVLHSISDTYIIDDYDICMLTYLPCKVDVYLDTYEEFVTSCALVYLHELRNDSAKFRSIVSSSYFRSLSDKDMIYQRDEICKLRNVFRSCLEMTGRNEHCLLDTFNFSPTLEDITSFNSINTTSVILNSTAKISTTPVASKQNQAINTTRSLLNFVLDQITPKQEFYDFTSQAMSTFGTSTPPGMGAPSTTKNFAWVLNLANFTTTVATTTTIRPATVTKIAILFNFSDGSFSKYVDVVNTTVTTTTRVTTTSPVFIFNMSKSTDKNNIADYKSDVEVSGKI